MTSRGARAARKPARTLGSRSRDLLRPTRPVGPTIVGAILLSALAAVAYLRRVLHGGFLSDDWRQAALWQAHRSFTGFLSADYQAYPYRPGDVMGLSLLYRAFGMHAKGHLAFSILISVIVCILLAEILRSSGFAAGHAYTIGAIALVAPYAASVRLWAIMGAGVVGIALIEVAILVGLRARHAKRRRFLLSAAAAAVLVAGGMLTYEVAAAVIVASILLFLLLMSARRALALWGAMLLGLVVATLESSRARRGVGATEQTSVSVIPGNVRRISGAIPDTVAHALFPLDTPSGRIVLATIVVVALVGGLTAWRSPDAARRTSLTRWLLLLAGGSVEALAGWAVFAASTGSPYSPADPGIGNRVNFVSSLGLAVGAYAVGAIVVEVVGAAATIPFRVVNAAIVALGLLLVLVYTRDTRAEVATYQSSYASELAVIGWFQGALPKPLPAASFLLYGAPLQVAPGVPVFGSTWELAGALQILYRDPAITTVPVSPAAVVSCTPTELLVNGGDVARLPYGRTYVADYRDRTTTLIRDQAQCSAVTSAAPVSPWVG